VNDLDARDLVFDDRVFRCMQQTQLVCGSFLSATQGTRKKVSIIILFDHHQKNNFEHSEASRKRRVKQAHTKKNTSQSALMIHNTMTFMIPTES
jgi:hypothetical protein